MADIVITMVQGFQDAFQENTLRYGPTVRVCIRELETYNSEHNAYVVDGWLRLVERFIKTYKAT
ncbi:hypothetical protein DFQ29_009481 [Apophysomyces sp. BC1021]|nr:hypothetical protein DFQ29_009481 [Apophysomyces sp. BC1021]